MDLARNAAQHPAPIATLRAMSGVLTCSIVIVDRWPDVDLTDLGGRAGAPEARGLISISEESWPQAAGSRAMRAIISIEADNPASIRWYARAILKLNEGHPAWLDMERQLATTPTPVRARLQR
jgi:hypothetical protein